MRTIGLLGGMSWQSTLSYYQGLNAGVQQHKGKLSSAPLLINSVDFAPYAELQHLGQWAEIGARLGAAAKGLEQGGAECIVLATNTMHKVASDIEAAISIPFLHIIDSTGEALQRDGIERVGLLGTAFTMQESFYPEYMENHFGITTLVPETESINQLHKIIFDELCLGVINPHSKSVMLDIIAELAKKGAQGVILGCTELALLGCEDKAILPLYDSAALHIDTVVNYCVF